MRKNEARSLAISLRRNINKNEISKMIIDDIIKSNILTKYNRIGIYYPIGKEIDIMNLMNHYIDKSFYLPITRNDNIDFIKYKLGDKLKDGLFNTKEPVGDIVLRDEIECFIIPCVAISKDNKRVGYGKGYYDRYLKDYKGLKIGVCYENSSNMDIIMDEFDVLLDTKFIG